MLTLCSRNSILSRPHGPVTAQHRIDSFVELSDQFEQLEQRSLMSGSLPILGAGLVNPANVATTVAPNSIRLTWTNTDTRVTGYNILRSTNNGEYTQLSRITTRLTTVFTDTSVTSNNGYRYKVVSYSASGLTGEAMSVPLTTPLVPPSAVAVTINGSSSVELRWRGNDANATGFRVMRSTDGRTYSLLTTINDNTTATYTDSTITTGVSYLYQLRATTDSNASAWTTAIRASISLTNPGEFNVTAAATSVSMSWSGIDANARNAVVQRSTDGGRTYTVLATLTRTATTYTDTAVATATNYMYRVLATNGVVSAGVSPAASVTTLLNTPRSVTAAANGPNVSVTWADSNRAGVGYKIMRSADGQTYSDLATVASSTARAYTDTSATPGQTFHYKVRAFFGSLNSDASAAASAARAQGTSTVTIASRYGSELVITSFPGADIINVSQGGSELTISINGQTFTSSVTTSGLFIYDRGGGDTITIDSSVTARTVISALAYGSSRITANATNTSIWVDRTDIVSGVGTNHVIQALAGNVSLAPGAALPNPTDSGNTTRVNKSLFGSGPSATDINQGAIGDCYFLASIAAFAAVNPAVMQEAAVDLGDGTYIVEFKRNGVNVHTRVSNAMPTGGFGGMRFAHAGANNTMWAQVMEKAFAHFRRGANTYASLNGGWMGEVNNAFGKSSSFISLSQSDADFYSSMSSGLSNRNAITFGTVSRPANLVGGHAYTLISATRDGNGVARYTVRNPWGVSGTSSENSGGYAVLTFAQMQANFSAGARAAA